MFPKLLNARLERKQAKVILKIDCCFKLDAYVMLLSLLKVTKELEKILRITLEKEFLNKCVKL